MGHHLKSHIIADLEDMGVKTLYGIPLAEHKKEPLLEAWTAFQQGAPTHLSYSQVNTFHRCGRQYKYRYMDKIVQPPPWALTLGGSVDVAQNYAYKTMIESGTVEPLDAIEDAFNEEYQKREQETVYDDRADSNDVVAKGRSVLKVFHSDVAPKKEPLEVQARCEVYFPERPYTFLGYIDLIAVENKETAIIDNKCVGRAYPQTRVITDNQLTAYSAIYQAQNGTNHLPVVGFDLLVHTKEAKAIQYRSVRTDQDVKRYFEKVNEVWEMIRLGIFPAHAGDSWECSERFCGYWGLCHEEYA